MFSYWVSVCLLPSRECVFTGDGPPKGPSHLWSFHIYKVKPIVTLSLPLMCVYICVRMFLCVYLPNIGADGDDGVSGKTWSHLKAVKEGNGHSFTNKYLILVHPTACHWDETQTSVRSCWIFVISRHAERECVLCSVTSLSQLNVVCNWVSVNSQKQVYSSWKLLKIHVHT